MTGWAWDVAFMGEMRNAYKILVRNPTGKRPLERPICKVEDNIKETGVRSQA
jgi:hypothetical protein